MPVFWTLDDEPQGLVLVVEATMEATNEGGWQGHVTTMPFGALSAKGPSFNRVREELAAGVLSETAVGVVPVPVQVIDAVRVMATSVVDYGRCGSADGPIISIPAMAARVDDSWCVATVCGAGPLAGYAVREKALRAAQDTLAESLLVWLEVGIDGIPARWSGIRMLTMTRRTYPARSLPAA